MEVFKVKFTIVNNEGEHLLTGCQGIYPSSTWKCNNCSEAQVSKCAKLLRGHPDFAGIDLV